MAELDRNKKFADKEGLSQIRSRHPDAKIVQCHGVFDVIHGGHLAYFESAKKFGDILVVTVTSDKFVNKGPGRPCFNSSVRASMLAALEVVDYVAVSDYPTAAPVIEALKPDFYVKGPDYKDKARDVTGGIYEEEWVVKNGGGKLVFTEDETHSSSGLINRFFSPWNEEQKKAIEAVQKHGGFDAIEEILGKLSNLKVCIIGEPIVDTYVFCQPEAISSKSPSISAKFISEENYAGGCLAIANHLSSFAKEVDVYITHGGEPYFKELLKERISPEIKVHEEVFTNIPTPRKTRFIEAFKSQRIFEITDISSDQWQHHEAEKFCQKIKQANRENDVTIISDFGHGLFEGKVLESLQTFSGFVSLNVQTNSSNFGFNPYTKHKRFSFLNIDTREVRLAYHDRFSAPLDLARRTQRDVRALGSSFAMTAGPNGAYYFPESSDTPYYSPAFSDNVIDATGAGDAFFALTSLLVKVGCPEVFVPFLGNVFAGLKTKIIGNKASVTHAQLVKAVASILK
jgi:rfaE bifunctional protein nucleotidyltransferase chain/domain